MTACVNPKYASASKGTMKLRIIFCTLVVVGALGIQLGEAEGNDSGSAARCTNSRRRQGGLACPTPLQNKCNHHDGWCTDDANAACPSSKCEEFWGSTIECDDGPINYKGVLVPEGDTSGQYAYAPCYSWDSFPAVLGLQKCTTDKAICTKMKSGHSDLMSKSAGLLVMKRVKCTSTSCTSIKSGKCYDAGEDVFDHIWDETNAGQGTHTNTLQEKNSIWAEKITAQLKAGTTNECSAADQAIAESVIRGY